MTSIRKEIYLRRPLLNLPQGAIHILDLVSLPCDDGAIARHRLSDSMLGMLLVVDKLGCVQKNLLEGFETMTTKGPCLRGAPVAGRRLGSLFWENFGDPFLGPDGLPMRFHLSTKQNVPFSILLHGSPPVPGESIYAVDNILQAPNALQWIVSTLLAGAPPAGFVYKLGSFDLSNLPLHLTVDGIDYESADDETYHEQGTNPWVAANNLRHLQYLDHPIGKGEELTNEERKTKMERAIVHSMYSITAWLHGKFPLQNGYLISDIKIMIGGQVLCSLEN